MTKKLYVDNKTILREQYFFLMRKAVSIGSRLPELEDVDPNNKSVQKLLDDFNAIATELDQLSVLINNLREKPNGLPQCFTCQYGFSRGHGQCIQP